MSLRTPSVRYRAAIEGPGVHLSTQLRNVLRSNTAGNFLGNIESLVKKAVSVAKSIQSCHGCSGALPSRLRTGRRPPHRSPLPHPGSRRARNPARPHRADLRNHPRRLPLRTAGRPFQAYRSRRAGEGEVARQRTSSARSATAARFPAPSRSASAFRTWCVRRPAKINTSPTTRSPSTPSARVFRFPKSSRSASI